MRSRMFMGLSGSLLLGLAGVSYGAEAVPSQATLETQMAALQAEVAQLRAAQDDSWMAERRAAEIKTLVRDVLADADTRASLLQDGMNAGHNGKNFFLASDNGDFLLNISGQLQMRYVASFQDEESETDEDTDESVSVVDDEEELGFVVRRAKVQFDGHIADPRLKYIIRLSVDRDDNTVLADRLVIAYELADGLTLWGGEDKGPFLREELISSSKQLAVERSYMNELFTLDYVQGVGVVWDAMDIVRVHAMINDGYYSGTGSTRANPFTQSGLSQTPVDEDGEIIVDDDDIPLDYSESELGKDFDNDRTDFAGTARVDVKIAGTWDQANDFTAWDGEEFAAFIGGAVHYEVGETGDSSFNNNFFSWTVDGSVEVARFNVYGAIVGFHSDMEDGSSAAGAPAADDVDLYGAVVQAGYQIPVGTGRSIEPFARYEYIDYDDIFGSDYDNSNIVTAGMNYYLAKHNAKFTFDVVWALDAIPLSQSGLGLQADDPHGDDQIVLRAQFQLLF